MEPDLKPIIIRAAESNNESEVKRLIDADADSVNETDNHGKTALFYAAQNNNEGIAVLLIDAGADVDAKDNQDKTPLFYAAANTCTEDASGTLTALVEKGDACVDAPDIYGRTPLFYAITESIACARYLLDNDGDKDAEDKCNVSILTYAVEHCLMKSENSTYLSDVLSLLAEKGLEKKSIVQSMLNLVFCKAPLLLGSDEKAILGLNIKKEDILKTLAVAIQYVDESCCEKREKILKVEEKIRSGEIFEALDLLRKLQARPNTTDSAGNTALHYATALPLMDVPQESVMRICQFLRKGANFSKPNHQGQTPLLFCLSPNNWTLTSPSNQISGSKTLVDVCAYLLGKGSKLNETLKSKENVFHLLINLFQQVLDLHDKEVRKSVLSELIKLLELFGQTGLEDAQRKIGNDHDENGYSPLRLWATLTLPSPQDYSSYMCENYTFEKFLKFLLDSLMKCGANMNDRNHQNETPLHVCKTWTAVKLLLDAGANPKDMDSSGRSPLLFAARSKTFLKHSDRFYPDVPDDPRVFWKIALENGLDPWMIDKQDKSVLSLLVEFESFVLARDLVEVACSEKHTTRDIQMSLLVAVCKDESKHTRWKSILVNTILGSRKEFLFAIDEALRCSCRNIKEFGMFDEESNSEAIKSSEESNDANRTEEQDEKENARRLISVHGEIAKLLVCSGADITAKDDRGESSLDIAENCPGLKDLLTKTVDANSVSIVIPWTSASKRYRKVLEKVAKQQECDQSLNSYWYHKNAIKTGRFGEIFAGISINDGREVAIKRIEKLRIEKLQRPRDTREVKNLMDLVDCQQVVRYLWFDDKRGEFSYVVLELMEGNLEEYLSGTFDPNQSIQLCQHVLMGIKYLHERNIIHRDVNPGNILYKVHRQGLEPCMKIADFGLSRRIDSSGSSTVYSIDSGTRCWIAPEVLSSSDDNYQHSKSSDVFSCGLVFHYILAVKRHPFSPADCAMKCELQVASETEANIMEGVMEGWDDSLSPEATHLLKKMLAMNEKERPSAEEALAHPLFWTNEKKVDLLEAVGNQEVFKCPRFKRTLPLTPVETDLQNSFSTIVKHGNWRSSRYTHMPDIYKEITKGKGIRKKYDTSSAVELVRFIRNVYEHFKEKTFVLGTVTIEQLLFADFVFLGYFPNLVMEVYKAVTTHGWDKTEDDIKLAMKNK